MKSRQRGYLLFALLLTLVSLTSVYLIASLAKQSSRADRRAQKETLRALADAKMALIAHGVIEDSTPGTLPKPSDVEGEQSLNGLEGKSYSQTKPPEARRFPWYTLGLSSQSDGNGDCLWYALSGIYSNQWSASERPSKGAMVNPNSTGALKLDGVPVVAVLLSSGPSLPSQTNRGSKAVGKCAAGSVDQFLEGTNTGTTSQYTSPAASPTINDTAVGVTHTEMLKPVLKRILNSLAGTETRLLIQLRMADRGTSGTLLSLRGSDPEKFREFDETLVRKYERQAGLTTGSLQALYDEKNNGTCPKVPVIGRRYKTPPSWLCFNDWYSHISFHADEHGRTLSVSLAPPSTYHCTMALSNGLTTCTD